jgi:predicted  nucleic acid-binding Zn-ribbon protein
MIKKVKTSDGFWCKISLTCAFMCCPGVEDVKEPRKEVIQEQAESSLLKTQVSEVACQIEALPSQTTDVCQHLSKLIIKSSDQATQLSELKMQWNIPNSYLDALEDQWRARNSQLSALLTEMNHLSGRIRWFNDDVRDHIFTQNTEFSALRNDIAAWKTATTALKAKVTDLEREMDKPLLQQE